MTHYAHYSDVPESAWPWENFTPQEIASKGDGSLIVDADALDRLQWARREADQPFVIFSAYRDPIHNVKVGGAPLSMHKFGKAFDISLRGHHKPMLADICRRAGFTGFGLNYKTFLHVDTGRNRSW